GPEEDTPVPPVRDRAYTGDPVGHAHRRSLEVGRREDEQGIDHVVEGAHGEEVDGRRDDGDRDPAERDGDVPSACPRGCGQGRDADRDDGVYEQGLPGEEGERGGERTPEVAVLE